MELQKLSRIEVELHLKTKFNVFNELLFMFRKVCFELEHVVSCGTGFFIICTVINERIWLNKIYFITRRVSIKREVATFIPRVKSGVVFDIDVGSPQPWVNYQPEEFQGRCRIELFTAADGSEWNVIGKNFALAYCCEIVANPFIWPASRIRASTNARLANRPSCDCLQLF